MTHDPTVQEALTALAALAPRLTDWERGFVHSLQHQTYPLRPKQQAVLITLAEDHCDPLLAAELRGQLRLFV
jgi:hypothetical protein